MKINDYESFKIFARKYPIDAYNLNPKDFCKFMHEMGYNLTEEQIKIFIYNKYYFYPKD
jgi:hypothetical protein